MAMMKKKLQQAGWRSDLKTIAIGMVPGDPHKYVMDGQQRLENFLRAKIPADADTDGDL